MFRRLRTFFRSLRSRRLQNRSGTPADDRLDIRNAHQGPPASPESRVTTDAEASNSLSQSFFDSAQELRRSSPQTCNWLDTPDIQDIGEHAVDGGRYADVLKGRLDGRDVAIKSYRCYVCFDCDRIRMRFYKEARAYSLLSHRNIVPFVGVYSSLKHPFSLVFDFMERLNMTEYLGKEPNARKVELVTGIARGLHHMHDLGVVHGNLESTNVLVDSDGTPRIAGLGSAFTQPSPVAWSENPHELTRCSAPELINPEAFGLLEAQTTEASDVYAFGVLAYQVFAGNLVFHTLNDTAAMYSMLGGSRPSRPDNPELSDRIWDMINKCWENTPSQRITIADAVSVLETELQKTRETPSQLHLLSLLAF
ncbi:kinase-like protein [Thelephora ganbajun]|uniref:Kinase-like protein n=1 Tax=Thelephora ganbajun TaxID=370292 RepID=A0ACB6Z5D3_THEGA|nr:kinase-like protein [Thelephora ganbajun]